MTLPVILESPYAGDVKRNVDYAWRCVIDSCRRGEAPFASHLLYTFAVDTSRYAREGHGGGDDPEHWLTREAGLQRCEAWRRVAAKTVFYVDLGWSSGMLRAMAHAEQLGQTVEIRTLGEVRVVGSQNGIRATGVHADDCAADHVMHTDE